MPRNEARIREAFSRHYRIESELGHGGMAYVFCARRLDDDEEVAVKVIRPEIAVGVGYDRFRREIAVLQPLDHPNICPLLETGEIGPFLYYTMPCIQGMSLKDRLLADGPLPVEQVVAVARDVGAALDYAHGQGVLHRDIKPENVLYDMDHWMLCDFGVARVLEAASSEALSPSGMVIGTPQYMSPEQGQAHRDLDGRSDLYALGCLLYESLAGHPPFTGPSPQAIIARHVKERVPPLRGARPDVPEHVEKAVLWALEKDRDDRPESARNLVDALRA